MTDEPGIESMEALHAGAYVIACSSPPWLRASISGSEALVIVKRGGHEWLGEGGSACLRAVMVSAAIRGEPAVMIRTRGWTPICMTPAYLADAHQVCRDRQDSGYGDSFGVSAYPLWGQSVNQWLGNHPKLSRLAVDPVCFEDTPDDVECPDEWRTHQHERRVGLEEFIADPFSPVPGVTTVQPRVTERPLTCAPGARASIPDVLTRSRNT